MFPTENRYPPLQKKEYLYGLHFTSLIQNFNAISNVCEDKHLLTFDFSDIFGESSNAHASSILYFANVLCAILQFTVRCIRCAAHICGLFHGIIIAWEFKGQAVYNQSCRWKVIKYHRETKYNRFMRIKTRFTWEGMQN